MDYNATKGGVDTVDLMSARCSTSRTTRRMVVFYRLLDIAGINSFKIFRANNPNNKILRRTYIYNLALALMEENLKLRATFWTLPQELQVSLKKYREISATETTASTRVGICYSCGSKKK
jgi:hypothetical protein